MFKVGRVSHYYERTKTVVIELIADLALGEKIKIYNPRRDDFEQIIGQIKIENENISLAKRGETIVLAVEKGVDIDAEIYKV